MATECLALIRPFLADADLSAASKLDPSTWIALVLGAVATLFVILRAKTRKSKDPLERSATSSSLSHQRNVERQMSSLLVELTEMSRSISAGLDTRAARLEALIEEADQKIAKLESLPAPSEASASSADLLAISPPVHQDIPMPHASSMAPIDPRYQKMYELSDQGRSLQEIAAALNHPIGEVEVILALRPAAAK